MSLQQAKLVFKDMTGKLGIKNGELNDDGLCKIKLKEEWMPSITVCYIDSKDYFLIFAYVGFFTDDRALEVLKELMHHQFLFDKSRDVCYSIDPENGAIVAQMKLAVSTLSCDEFICSLEDFVDEVKNQRIFLYRDGNKTTDKSVTESERNNYSNIIIG